MISWVISIPEQHKQRSHMKRFILALAVLAGAAAILVSGKSVQQAPRGAWKNTEGNITRTLVLIDDYFSLTEFDIANRKFYYTTGGTAKYEEGRLTGKVEYHSMDKSLVGKTYVWPVAVSGTTLMLNRSGKEEAWAMMDDGKGDLAGNWRISGREQNGQMIEIKPAARKTIKLLSGHRFQWAAINTDTGEFFGTGGGAYTFKNGIYTEQIEFFSRDSSRVGMSLSFNGKVDGRNWHHSGKSSRGEPISEVWSR
jgi:hypothetical protein